MATTKERAEIELVINNKVAKNSLKELRLELIEESRILDKMKKQDDPAGWLAQAKKVGIMRMAVKQANDEINASAGSFAKFASESAKISVGWKDIMAGFIGGNVAENLFNLLKDGIVSTVTRAGELSDSFADVQKATGMTRKEVEDLNNQLGSLNTRTPVEELRKMAEIGGRFGVAKEEIKDFVETADMLNVAFGDQFDSVEDLADQTLKLRNIFQDIKSDNIGDDILHIGNAMNVLEADGAATGKGLADFSNRIGGVLIPLGATTAGVLGLSAAMEELNITPERGSTAITTIMQKMLTDTTSFAKVAKMEVKDFEKLLNTDLLGAFMAFAKGAKEGGKTGTEFAKILADTELAGSGASEVLLKLASNQELVERKVKLAGEAIQSTTSVTAEFNAKNENAAAVLEKLGRAFSKTWDRIASSVASGIEYFGKMVGLVNTMNETTGKYYAQQQKVNGLEAGMVPLINRYEKLKKQTSLNKDEQAEMKNILDRIAEVLPNSVTKFDQYGNAIEFSTGKARDAIEVQRQLLKVLNKDAVKEVDNELVKAQRTLENNRKLLNMKTGSVEFEVGKGQVIKSRSEEDSRRILQNYRDQIKIIEELKKKRKELLGEVDAPAAQKPLTGESEEQKNVRLAGEKSERDRRNEANKDSSKKILEDRKRLNDELLKEQQDQTLTMLSAHAKEIQAAQFKYDKLRELAHGNADQLAKIEELRANKFEEINGKYTKKYLSDFDKTIRAQLNLMNEKQKEEFKYEQDRLDDIAKRQDKELFEINSHYEREIALAKSKGKSIVDIEKAWRAEVEALEADRGRKAVRGNIDKALSGMSVELAENEGNPITLIRKQIEEIERLQELYRGRDYDAEKDLALKKKALKEMELEVTKQHISDTGQILTAGSQVFSDLLSLTASNQGEYAEFQKALGLFQIAVDTGTAVASAVAAGTKGDPYTVALRIATAIAAVTGGMLKAKQLMSEAEQPSTPAFREHGGYTDLATIAQDNSGNPEGWVSRPTLFNLGRRSFVAGEGYKKEYVLSSAMLKDPAIADFVGGVEALRQGRFFENGGSTAMAPARPAASHGNPNAKMEKLLEALLHKQGNWDYSILEKYADNLESIRDRASA